MESNFERFVRAKTTIDNVYAEMRNQGAESAVSEAPRARSHITSRGSAHFRKSSAQGPFSPKGVDKPLPSDKKKHALVKESDYGVQGIKAPLIEVAVKAEEIWGPALGGREREDKLRSALASVEQSRGIFEVSPNLSSCIKRRDYEGLVGEYRKARRYAEEARATANQASSTRIPLTDPQVYQLVITARMWSDVETQIDEFKRGTWKRLTNVEALPASSSGQDAADEPMALIGVLLDLGVEDNPISSWLWSRYDYLKAKIAASFERSRVEIEILRRRLANANPLPSRTAVNYLEGPGDSKLHEKTQQLDNPAVLELWDLVCGSVSNLLSTSGGLLSEIIEFWDNAQAFIDGKVQRTLPIGLDGQSRKHHRLSTDEVKHLHNGLFELIEMLRDDIFAFFAEPPIEDVSMLYSPLPPTTPNTPKSAVFAPFAHQDSRFKFDASNPPPPSPKRGEAWEDFAFWPPHANALGGIHYLEKVINLVGGAAMELASLRPVSSFPKVQEGLKTLINGARERCVSAVAAAWIRDAEMFHLTETFARSSERRDLTKMPGYFLAYENAVLSGLQKLAYIPGVTSKASSTILITPPTSTTLKLVRGDFTRTIYVLLSDMVKDAQASSSSSDTQSLQSMDNAMSLSALTIDGGLDTSGHAKSQVSFAQILLLQHFPNRPQSIRLVLTMSNIKHFQADLVPQLVTHFETAFSLKIPEDLKKLKDALSQIEARLFKAYITAPTEKLSSLVYTGITSPHWVPTTDRPTELRPYVYEALLLLVCIHTELATSAPALLPTVISYLFEQIVTAFLSAFRARTERYTLAALMQATLDVEFVASILSQYTTAAASELQNQVYQELDQRTDNSARVRLQNELPEMRAILKKLREGTRGEFACFKKQRVRG